jgi:hypothetical protein
MKHLIIFCAIGLAVHGAQAQSFDEFVTSIARPTGDRFESTEPLVCPNGSVPNLTGYFQYSPLDQSPGYWAFGTAKSHAPFIWLGRDYENKPILGLTAAVTVDWVFCDDDGDTFERSSSFPFRAVYSAQGQSASPVLTRQFFVRNSQGQRTGLVNPSVDGQIYTSLRDFDPYATGQIDGPSDEPILYGNPSSLEMSFEPVRGNNSFVTVFRNACGLGQDLKISYIKSLCDFSDGNSCFEYPEVL